MRLLLAAIASALVLAGCGGGLGGPDGNGVPQNTDQAWGVPDGTRYVCSLRVEQTPPPSFSQYYYWPSVDSQGMDYCPHGGDLVPDYPQGSIQITGAPGAPKRQEGSDDHGYNPPHCTQGC